MRIDNKARVSVSSPVVILLLAVLKGAVVRLAPGQGCDREGGKVPKIPAEIAGLDNADGVPFLVAALTDGNLARV